MITFAFLAVSTITITLPSTFQAQTNTEISRGEFESKIIRALEAEDEEQLSLLVKENRYKVYSLVGELLDASVRDDLDGNSDMAQDKLNKAAILAGLYGNVFDEDYLLNRVKLYQGWSREEREKKKEADVLMSDGKAARGKSDFQSALEKFSAALRFYRELGDMAGKGQASKDVGIIYYSLGQYEKGVEYFEQSLNICKEIGDREGEGKALNCIGVICYSLGQYWKAEEYYQQSLDICREVGDRQGEGKAYNNIGIVCSNLGQYRKAIGYHKQALNIRREIWDRRGEGISLNSIAGIFDALGQYEKAIEYNEQALNVCREIGDREGEATALNNMGDIYMGLDQYEKAIEYLELSLDIHRQIGDRKGEEISLNSIGYSYRILEQYEKAIDYLERSLNVCREIGDRRGEGINLIDLGSVYCDLDQHQEALENCQEGLEIALSIGAVEVIWPAQMLTGTIYEKQGDTDKALGYYAQSIATIESVREQLGIESLKTHFLADKMAVYNLTVGLLAEKGRYEQAFHYTERAKARALLDLLSLDRVDITEGISPELLAKNKALESRLNKIQQNLFDENSKPKSVQNMKLMATLEDSLKRIRSEHEEILREIELNHSRYATLTGVKEPLTLKEVQERVLDDGVALIEYMVGEDGTIAWVVREKTIEYENIEINRAELDSLVKQWRQPFKDVKEGKIDNLADVRFDAKLSHELYRRIFRPLEKHLQRGDALVIVPDGRLHYLPFEALISKVEEKEYDKRIVFSEYEDVHYLVEKYPISYGPSASILDPELKRPRVEADEWGKLLAFGNPDFGKAGEREGRDNFLSLLIRDSKGWVFNPLPKSEEEIDEITLTIKPSEKFLRQEAKEEYFKQRAGNFEMIHLATHGILEEKQPLYSRIVFAQDDDPTEDGFLQTYEIFNLPLNADLVVLSACETGLGELSQGEGLIGLTRAFMYAGAASVLVSLWSVEESTSRLMRDFYRNLKEGMTKTEALRRAKIKLIHTRESGMSYAHPFLWAPFVLMGEGR